MPWNSALKVAHRVNGMTLAGGERIPTSRIRAFRRLWTVRYTLAETPYVWVEDTLIRVPKLPAGRSPPPRWPHRDYSGLQGAYAISTEASRLPRGASQAPTGSDTLYYPDLCTCLYT
jgi:hypothetical protein